MPIIRKADIPTDASDPSRVRKLLINADLGAQSLTVGELTVGPGGNVPLHTHPTHEEGMLILEGAFESLLGDERGIVEAGDVLIVPAGIKHQLVNNSQQQARFIFIFPTTDVTRRYFE